MHQQKKWTQVYGTNLPWTRQLHRTPIPLPHWPKIICWNRCSSIGCNPSVVGCFKVLCTVVVRTCKDEPQASSTETILSCKDNSDRTSLVTLLAPPENTGNGWPSLMSQKMLTSVSISTPMSTGSDFQHQWSWNSVLAGSIVWYWHEVIQKSVSFVTEVRISHWKWPLQACLVYCRVLSKHFVVCAMYWETSVARHFVLQLMLLSSTREVAM